MARIAIFQGHRDVPDEPRQLIGTCVPIHGSNASWGSTALPPPGSEERNSYPPAKIGGWRRWQTKNQDLEWAHRSYILFATTNDSDFTGLASRNVAYVGIPGVDGEIEWDWFFFYRNPASLLRQIKAKLDRLDEMQSRGAGARDGRGTCPLVPISSKYASMEEACAAAGITVAEAMHLGASLRAIIAMKLPAAMEEVGVRMNRGTLTKAIEMVPDLFFQHLQRLQHCAQGRSSRLRLATGALLRWLPISKLAALIQAMLSALLTMGQWPLHQSVLAASCSECGQ